MSYDLKKQRSENNLSLKLICSENKSNCINVMSLTHQMFYCHPEGFELLHITGPKMYEAVYYFMDSFEHIYFHVNNYINSDRNLRQVNRSLFWISTDYEKFKDLPEINEVIKHCHNFFNIIFTQGLLEVEAYEALEKLKKAEGQINKEIEQLNKYQNVTEQK